MKYLSALSFIALTLLVGCKHKEQHWSYHGACGPSHWGELDQKYRTASEGHQQSPIDLISSNAIKTSLDKLELNYSTSTIQSINNGHTVKSTVEGLNSIKLGSDTYQLLQFHFHNPSEHFIDSRPYPIELHFVHKNQRNELCVIGVMLKLGKENQALSGWLASAPQVAGKRSKMKLDFATILPKKLDYYTYKGSLTTPPCSEGVRWLILSEVVEISAEQLRHFQEIYLGNARPVQELYQRNVKASI